MKKIVNNFKKWNPSKYATILLFMVPLITFLIIGFRLDNDFWFLINTGKTILKEGFIRIEPFTIHSGLSYIPQQWLTDIIFNLIYTKFDIRGMYYFTIICNFLIVYIFYKLSFLVSNNRKKSLFIAILADVCLIFFRFLSTRPQIFDIIVFSLELFLLESYISKNNKKYLFPMPILSLFLINAHASMWPMFFAFMLPYLVEYVIMNYRKKETYNAFLILIVFILSLLIGYLNPYGMDAINYLVNSYGNSEINNLVHEMKNIDIDSMFGIFCYILFFIIFLSFYHNKGKNKIRYCLLSMGIIVLSLQHYKGVVELIILFPIIFGYNLKNKETIVNTKNSFFEKIVYIVLTIGLLFGIIIGVKLSDNLYIKEFADYLDENATSDIKLFTDYNNGGYLEYRGYKCYIDPRAEVFLKSNNHKEDIFHEYFLLNNNILDVKEFLNKYNFDYLLLDNTLESLLKELQDNPNYEEVYSKITNSSMNETTYLFKYNPPKKK